MAQTSLIRTRAKYTCQTIGRYTFGPVADSAVPAVEADVPVLVLLGCTLSLAAGTIVLYWCAHARTPFWYSCADRGGALGQVCVIFEVLRGTEMPPLATKGLGPKTTQTATLIVTPDSFRHGVSSQASSYLNQLPFFLQTDVSFLEPLSYALWLRQLSFFFLNFKIILGKTSRFLLCVRLPDIDRLRASFCARPWKRGRGSGEKSGRGQTR
eukprot:2751218-Rhodomonas_salina.1